MKKDFITIADFSPSELQSMLDLAIELKKEYFSGGNRPLLKGKVLGIWLCAT
jgi:ornithine carbamoyltransferase